MMFSCWWHAGEVAPGFGVLAWTSGQEAGGRWDPQAGPCPAQAPSLGSELCAATSRAGWSRVGRDGAASPAQGSGTLELSETEPST